MRRLAIAVAKLFSTNPSGKVSPQHSGKHSDAGLFEKMVELPGEIPFAAVLANYVELLEPLRRFGELSSGGFTFLRYSQVAKTSAGLFVTLNLSRSFSFW